MSPSLPDLPIHEIRKRYLEAGHPVTRQALNRLKRDPRSGVQQLVQLLERRFEREQQERLRLEGLLHFERLLWKANVQAIAGVDEAGVGPLAGPVVAAAVVFPPGTVIEGMDDSKKLDAGQREALAGAIRKRARGIGIGLADVLEIDHLNIYHAALLAMRRALDALPEPPNHVLVDARTIPDLDIPQNCFDRGDGINFSIAAASIIAKTHRDHLMDELDALHPGYGFARHKGYATQAHQAAIARLGPCEAHRRSFTFIRELRGEYSGAFYDLREAVQRASSRQDLRGCEAEFEAGRADLEPAEQKKLRLMISRRWKAL